MFILIVIKKHALKILCDSWEFCFLCHNKNAEIVAWVESSDLVFFFQIFFYWTENEHSKNTSHFIYLKSSCNALLAFLLWLLFLLQNACGRNMPDAQRPSALSHTHTYNNKSRENVFTFFAKSEKHFPVNVLYVWVDGCLPSGVGCAHRWGVCWCVCLHSLSYFKNERVGLWVVYFFYCFVCFRWIYLNSIHCFFVQLDTTGRPLCRMNKILSWWSSELMPKQQCLLGVCVYTSMYVCFCMCTGVVVCIFLCLYWHIYVVSLGQIIVYFFLIFVFCFITVNKQ